MTGGMAQVVEHLLASMKPWIQTPAKNSMRNGKKY
jgi:hypothetical protein